MADVKWIKLTTDMFDNRKIKHLRKLPDGNNIVLLWVMLLTMAGRCNSGGRIYLTENIPYSPKMLADELDFEESTVVLALNALEELQMIVTDEGYYTIAGWEEYQNIEGMEKLREYNRIAQQKARAKRKALNSGASVVNDVVNDMSMTVKECQGTEEERDRDKDKDKEYHSFIHSAENVENFPQNPQSRRNHLGGIGKGVVLLSDAQMSDLLDKLTIDEFDRYVSIVAECELNGRHYKKKTHYQAILDMAAKDRKVM